MWSVEIVAEITEFELENFKLRKTPTPECWGLSLVCSYPATNACILHHP